MDSGRPALIRVLHVAAAALPAAFLALFFAYPLIAILERGLTSADGFALPTGTSGLLWFTVWQAAASTALTLAAGLPLAWVLGRFRFRGRSLVRAIVLVPFVLPTVVVATAFLAVLPGGYEHGIWAILAAHVFFNVAVVARIVGGAWASIDPAGAEAATVLGAGPLRRVREVTLPQLAPALSAASALTFLFCFTSFGVILILGGPGRATIETEIYNRAARLFDLQAAAALSVLQLVAVGLVLTAVSILEARAARAGRWPTSATRSGLHVGASESRSSPSSVSRVPRSRFRSQCSPVAPLGIGVPSSAKRRRCSSSRGRPPSTRSRSQESPPRSRS